MRVFIGHDCMRQITVCAHFNEKVSKILSLIRLIAGMCIVSLGCVRHKGLYGVVMLLQCIYSVHIVVSWVANVSVGMTCQE